MMRTAMGMRVSGKNMDIGDALRQQVEARLSSAVAKYFDGSHSGHVTVARDGTGFRTECVLHLSSGVTLEASGAAHDAHASFEQTADRIEKRLRRYKRRLKDRQGGAQRPTDALDSAYSVLEPPPEDEHDGGGEFHPVVIAETTRPLHRFSVSEAVVELDLTGAPAIVFVHAGTGRVNVVYRRSDGMIGWIDPPAERA
jgi:ribosomal subunit interface protein